jgi:TfoX/Sxy family transcriptional regulator of competence genes
MAYDEQLAERIRRAIGPRPDVTEKKMFGGVAFLQRGKMFCGLATEDLMVRIGPERCEAALTEAHVRPMDFTGRPMNGPKKPTNSPGTRRSAKKRASR